MFIKLNNQNQLMWSPTIRVVIRHRRVTARNAVRTFALLWVAWLGYTQESCVSRHHWPDEEFYVEEAFVLHIAKY